MTTVMKGSERWLLPLSFILLVMGGLVGAQVHTQSLRGDMQVGRRISALGEVLRANQTQVEAQLKEIETLRQQVAKYESQAVNDQGLTKLITEELQNSRAALGLVPLTGPGITLEIGDSSVPAIKGMDADPWLIHDYDLIQLANELWADGAEAISVNGQRIVAGSSIICSGRLVQVNHVPISAPFVFTAIGHVDNLVSGLNIRNGVLDTMKGWGFKVKLTRQAQVQVPAISVAPKFKFASPVLTDAAQEVPR